MADMTNKESARDHKAIMEALPVRFSAIHLILNLEEQWEGNLTSALPYLRCSIYHWGTNTMLIGDAAQATVPFDGEDVNGILEGFSAFCMFESSCVSSNS